MKTYKSEPLYVRWHTHMRNCKRRGLQFVSYEEYRSLYLRASAELGLTEESMSMVHLSRYDHDKGYPNNCSFMPILENQREQQDRLTEDSRARMVDGGRKGGTISKGGGAPFGNKNRIGGK